MKLRKEIRMAITINLYYTGTNGNARRFAEEMVQSGIVHDLSLIHILYARESVSITRDTALENEEE